jgi:tetratricopeptide (TPR) repeat protein
MDTHATVLLHQLKIAEAESLMRQCHQLRERILGPNHVDTLTTLGNLGSLLADEGRWVDAEQIHRDVIKRSEQAGRSNNPESFATYANLGTALFAQDRFEESEKVLVDLLKKTNPICGAEHPDTLHTQHILARVLAGAGRWADAEKIARDTLKIRKRDMPRHEGTGRTLLVLGHVLVEKGELVDAESFLRDALAIFQDKYAMKTELTAQAENWLGTIQLRRCEFGVAETLLIRSCGPLLTASAISEAERRELIGHLVELYDAWGKADAAAEWTKRIEEVSSSAQQH